MLVWAEEARARHEELQDDSTRIEALDAEVARAEAELTGSRPPRSARPRTKAAKDLSARVSAELTALAMADATLVINVEPAGQLGPFGADEISLPAAAALRRAGPAAGQGRLGR